MPDFSWLNDDLADKPEPSVLWLNEERVSESPDTLDRPLKMLSRPRRRVQLRALRQEKLEEFFTALPQPGESLHIVSNGSFDYWNFVPVILQMIGKPCAFYGSTWTMNRSNVLQLLALLDEKKLTSATMFSGLYFKRREPAVYNALASGLIDRGQRFLCFENHTKIMLISDSAANHITIEGSANFTANPRTEQNVLTNDLSLHEFHRSWMEKLLEQCQKQTPPRLF